MKIGLLGGGQLGRMLLQSAYDFDLDFKVIDPNPEAPCSTIIKDFHQGDIQDYQTVVDFGKGLDLLTIEIEKVNTKALKALEASGVSVFPQAHIIELIQDKRVQKQFYLDHKIPTSPFVLVKNRKDIASKASFLPAINKIAKDGYDGRGVQKVSSLKDLDKAFDAPGLLEKIVDFEKEISVIVARRSSGEIKTFPTVELVFHPVANLVEYLFSPADISQETENEAQSLAKTIAEKLEIVGLLAVEMFVEKDGSVLVNEVAPRTHNSGHQSIEGNVCSQFEQQLRAILNWPLGDTATIQKSVMINLLGAEGFTGPAIYDGMEEILKIPGVHPHIYGKKLTKPFRKMGHITITGDDLEDLKKKAKFVKDTLIVKA